MGRFALHLPPGFIPLAIRIVIDPLPIGLHPAFPNKMTKRH